MATPPELTPVDNSSDLPPHSSQQYLNLPLDGSTSFGSINMDELLVNIYANTEQVPIVNGEGISGAGARTPEPNMTLEDYLSQAGAVNEEELRISAMPFGAGEVMHAAQFSSHPLQVQAVGFDSGIDGRALNLAAEGNCKVGRGKRRAVEEAAMDRVSQRKQNRMIKNRESAARSRDRKHAYTVELEALVTKLEGENAKLLREEVSRL